MTRPPARSSAGRRAPGAGRSTAAFYIPGGIRTLIATLPTYVQPRARLAIRTKHSSTVCSRLFGGAGVYAAASRSRSGYARLRAAPRGYVRVSLCARAGTSAAASRSAAQASGGATPPPPAPSPPPSLAASTCRIHFGSYTYGRIARTACAFIKT